MLKFNAYTGRELRNFMALLNQVEAQGLGIEILKDQLQSYLNEDVRKSKQIVKFAHRKQPTQRLTCPECNIYLVPVANKDGLNIWGCKKCRYSKIVKEI